MRQRIEGRLLELRKQMWAGREKLQALESQAAELRETLTRIGGAILVLEELLATGDEADEGDSDSSVGYPRRMQLSR